MSLIAAWASWMRGGKYVHAEEDDESRGDRGQVRMRTELVLRFDYGNTVPWVTRLSDGTIDVVPTVLQSTSTRTVQRGTRFHIIN